MYITHILSTHTPTIKVCLYIFGITVVFHLRYQSSASAWFSPCNTFRELTITIAVFHKVIIVYSEGRYCFLICTNTCCFYTRRRSTQAEYQVSYHNPCMRPSKLKLVHVSFCFEQLGSFQSPSHTPLPVGKPQDHLTTRVLSIPITYH